MSRALCAAALLASLLAVSGAAAAPQAPPPPALGQRPGIHPPPPEDITDSTKRTGELDCRGCHLSKHQGVLRMYVGMGGRGTPMIPSHMFQVRVECVACHVAPKETSETAGLVGQTFKPSEQACVNCHGEKYRGMLGRWTSTLPKMLAIVSEKLGAVRPALEAASAKDPKRVKAAKLLDDAQFNLNFVALGKGVHNVFYSADLLKLANGWADEAGGLLDKAPSKVDDTLVRGGYCAVLCHEQARVKQPETVAFKTLRLPHVRHVTEFGATCTSCHSAEVHKAVTATPATCTSCHHSPQNERCESCHRVQSAFYRGQTETPLVKLEPNVMVSAVTCTGCHDWTQKHSRQAVAVKCVGCHDKGYAAFATEWTAGFDKQTTEAASAVKRAETALAQARKAGRKTAEADARLKEAKDALALVRRAKGVHNPSGADALLDVAKKKAAAAVQQSAAGR